MNLSATDFLIVATTFIILVVVLMMVMIYGIFIKKKSKLLMEHQKKDALFEQELAISQIEIKEQTLNYIGQELHDDLGQKLSVARLMTNKITFSSCAENVHIAKEINMLVGECIQDIRNLSKVFITGQIEHFGLVDSIEREVRRIKRLDLLEVDYQINNGNFELDSDHSLILFRIVQECITNVIKHSKSNVLRISLENEPTVIRIIVEDKGIGMIMKEIKRGTGLINMENRAKLIGAGLKINSLENVGTRVTLVYNK
ncbi:sensor histidine kinase [Chryseobacterium koreense]|uniref:sensor histidine kinase n=1 Tax=Chryseobacterium koreense TaxID=232216 RepID=UPI0026EAB24B|nr:ATP-binding protein [Chryseobacterium koreense]